MTQTRLEEAYYDNTTDGSGDFISYQYFVHKMGMVCVQNCWSVLGTYNNIRLFLILILFSLHLESGHA